MELTNWLLLLQGLWVTTWICGVSIAIGLVMGLIIALIRLKKIPLIDQLLAIYISLARATPLIPLVFFISLLTSYYGFYLNNYLVAIITLVINTTAFNAETWLTAFKTFPKEQREAAEAYGMTRGMFFRRIMLPQVIISSLPGLINEMSFLIKGSPAIFVVGVMELSRVSYQIGVPNNNPLPPLTAACFLYMLLMGAIILLQHWAERHADRLSA